MCLLFLSVLFYSCGILYYLYDHLQHVFDTVKDDIKLLKAVHFDLQIQVIFMWLQSSLSDKLIL